MSLNCNEINLILSELSLTGAFIQDIVQPGYDTLAIYTYKEGTAKTVLICTAQNSVRINETRRKITKNEKPLRFMEFLRARIKGCRINSIEQIGLERVIKIQLSRTVSDESPKKNEQVNSIQLPGLSEAFGYGGSFKGNVKIQEEVLEHIENYNLYIKLWNNAANVILCDENDLILEPMFRRPERFEIKDETFIPPAPVPEKFSEAETKFPIREWKYNFENDAGGVAGAHKTTADKMEKSAAGQSDDSPAGRGSEKDRSECNERGLCSEGKAFPSFNSYIDWWYSEHAQSMSRESLLEKAEKWFNINHSKQENALNNLLKKQAEFQNAALLKHQGDLVLSYGYLIDGSSKFLECEDYDSGEKVRLLIDPKKSVQENAAEYYKNYKKAVSGADELQHDIEIAKKQLLKLEEQYDLIKKEQNPIKIEQLLRHESAPKQQLKKSHPGLDFTVNGWLIYVGRDANENDELLRHYVRGDDLWLHVRDFPGGYVFIKAQKNKTVPLDILLDAGNLAVYYSKARSNTKVDLYYTHVKYLRRAKNGPKGLVLPTQEKNLCISPDKERLSRLDALQKVGELLQ